MSSRTKHAPPRFRPQGLSASGRTPRARRRSADTVEAGATAYLPADAGVSFPHVALTDGERIELGNTVVTVVSTLGHALAHASYVVADRRRGNEEPWLVFTGDALLVGDVGRSDLHAAGNPELLARALHGPLRRLLEIPDGVLAL